MPRFEGSRPDLVIAMVFILFIYFLLPFVSQVVTATKLTLVPERLQQVAAGRVRKVGISVKAGAARKGGSGKERKKKLTTKREGPVIESGK